MGTKKTSSKKVANKVAKVVKAAKTSADPAANMRKKGYVLIQTWASPRLKKSIDARAVAVGKFKSIVIREVLGVAAEKWDGLPAGSMQTLRPVKGASTATAAAPATTRKDGGSATTKKESAAKAKVAKSGTKAGAKSARKSPARSSAARQGVKGAADVGAGSPTLDEQGAGRVGDTEEITE